MGEDQRTMLHRILHYYFSQLNKKRETLINERAWWVSEHLKASWVSKHSKASRQKFAAEEKASLFLLIMAMIIVMIMVFQREPARVRTPSLKWHWPSSLNFTLQTLDCKLCTVYVLAGDSPKESQRMYQLWNSR